MSDTPNSIEPDAKILQTLSCLTEKFVVDFANGIDVVHDHLRVQQARTDFFSRMRDGFTGKGLRRQVEINESLADGVEASLQWLVELTESLAHSNLAVSRINERVTTLTANATQIAHYSADTRQQLESLSQRLDQRLHGMTKTIARIDFIQKAQLNMDATFDKWSGGRFAALSPAARCYAAMEEMRWGALGDYFRHYRDQRQCHEFIQMVTDRATRQLATDAAISPQAPAPMGLVWLSRPSSRPGRHGDDDDTWQALAYIASSMPADHAPFVNSALQQHPSTSAVPLIADARRIADAMAQEIFTEEAVNV